MSTATAERGHCAPENGKARSLYEPTGDARGDFAPGTMFEAKPFPCPPPPQLRPGVRVRLREEPTAPARTITGVLTEETLDGVVKRLRLSWVAPGFFGPVEHSFLVSPALVFVHAADNVAPDAVALALSDLTLKGYAVLPSDVKVEVRRGEVVGDVAPEPTPREGLQWVQSAEDRIESRCGRFAITADARPREGLTARDLWTGEEAGGLATAYAAKQWCRVRTEVPPVSWSPRSGGGFVGEWAGLHFEVYQTVGGWRAIDPRFGATGLAAEKRTSPRFDTAEGAKAWCAARAGCSTTGADGSGKSLRFDVIPF